MILRLILPLCLLAPAAMAGMTAEEFEAYTKGKTLFYSVNGADYGVERYLEGRRVQWSFLDGECTDGVWYEQAGAICFAYDGWGTPQCWNFEQTPSGLSAEFVGDSEEGAQYLAYDRGEEMVCLGPDTGV